MSDNGKYIGNEFDNYLKTNGIEHRLSVPYCLAEHKNCTLVEMVRCLLPQSLLPLYLWAEVVNTEN